MRRWLQRIRISAWGAVTLCLFLPFYRGCDNKPVLPYQEIFRSPIEFLTGWFMLTYPVLLLALYWLVRKVRQEKLRLTIVQGAYLSYFSWFTYGLIQAGMPLVRDWLENGSIRNFWGNYGYQAPFVLLWIGMFVGVGHLSRDGLLRRLMLLLSMYSCLVLMLHLWVWGSSRLIGLQLASLSSAVVLLTFAGERWLQRQTCRHVRT